MKGDSEANRELVGFFLDFLKAKSRKSASLVASIERDLKRLLAYLEAENLDIDSDSIRAYVDYLREQYNESTLKTKISNLRQFIKWLDLKDLSLEELNHFSTVQIEVEKDFYTYAELKEIFSVIEDKPELLLLQLLFELSMSPKELFDLKLSHFNFATESFNIRDTQIKLSGELALELKNYFSLIGNLHLETSIPLALGEKFDTEMKLNQILKRYKLQARKLKRSFTIYLLESGLNIRSVEERTGIRVPSNYFQFAKETQEYKFFKAFKEFHPRA